MFGAGWWVEVDNMQMMMMIFFSCLLGRAIEVIPTHVVCFG
jgi:hypothetical protein